MKILLFIIAFASLTAHAQLYVAPSGADTNPGTITAPFRTLTKAYSAVQGGGLIYLRGGVYATTSQMNISGKSGTAAQYTRVWAYPGEHPVFDFTASTDHSPKTGLQASSMNYVHFKGFRITGVIQYNASAYYGMGLGNNANNNIVENCEFDNIGGTGFSIAANSSNNLILNCDAHHCADPLTAKPYDFSNGFDCTNQTTSLNNEFRYCRAWWISDDGFDGFKTMGMIKYTGCWSFWNGYKPGTFETAGNGDGFKFGQANGSSTLPLRIATGCLAFENRFIGFDQNFTDNNNAFPVILYNNTAAGNKYLGFFFSLPQPNQIKNCAAYNNNVNIGSASMQAANLWATTAPQWLTVSSLGMDGPRQADGSLPILNYMRPAPGSPMIGKAVAVTPPATDIGALQSGTGPIPPVTYSSAARAGSFTRNNCATGYIGGTAIYTVEAGKYTSTVSQADADSKATQDVAANGQSFANLNAVCTIAPPPAPTLVKTIRSGGVTYRLYSDHTWK